MKNILLGVNTVDGLNFSLVRTEKPNGKNCFTALVTLSDGEHILLDHWNLAQLRRKVKEVVPVMEMARQIGKNERAY